MSPVRKAVLEAGVLELGNFEYASGKRGNNKLNFDRLFEPDNQPRLEVVLHHLGHLVVERFWPELLVGIPSGGEKLADRLAISYDLPVAYLDKVDDEPGRKSYRYRTTEDEIKVLNTDRLVIVEDVFNRFTSTLGALAVPGVSERAQAVVAIWDRGRRHPSRGGLTAPYEAMVTEYIPPFLNEYDELYGFGVKLD